MTGTNSAVTGFGAAGAGIAFLGTSLIAAGAQYGIKTLTLVGVIMAGVGGACSAVAMYLAKGKDVTGVK